MKKTMTRILLLASALILALGVFAYAEEEEAAASTIAYIFWQDQDWWPAASSKADDYWTPTPAIVTGEGWYTVKVDAHMPGWFYSGGNSNIGAQKFAVVIKDGNTLFPNLYMHIVEVRIDGVSYPCGDVTYGQTGYDNINTDDGNVYWAANDTYALLYDQWMIDNGGSIGTGTTWNSKAQAQNFQAFDVSALNNPKSIEIDFFLSAQQDVKPEGMLDLRVLGEGPNVPGKHVSLADLIPPPAVAADAYIFWQDQDWWPATSNNKDTYWTPTAAVVTGEGHYTASVRGHMPNWFVEQGQTNKGAQKLAVVIADGADKFPGMYMQITDIRVDGVSYACGDVTYGQTGYNNINSDDGTVYWDANDTYGLIYDQYMIGSNGEIWNGKTWDSSATAQKFDIFDVSVLDDPKKIEIDFFLSNKQDVEPEVKVVEPPKVEYKYSWYKNNTMGVAGYSLRDDLGITDKWYNVVPVDLTKNGIYKIPLVASNMHIIGNAIVTVAGDDVTVTYETRKAHPSSLTVTSECVKWFKQISDITDEFCDNPQSDMAFGDTISKSELGNVGYLFICNRVNYSQPVTNDGIYLPRYIHAARVWIDYRAGLDAMVAELTGTVESPAAE